MWHVLFRECQLFIHLLFFANSSTLVYNSGNFWKSDSEIIKTKEEQKRKTEARCLDSSIFCSACLTQTRMSFSAVHPEDAEESEAWCSLLMAGNCGGVSNYRYFAPACNDLLHDLRLYVLLRHCLPFASHCCGEDHDWKQPRGKGLFHLTVHSFSVREVRAETGCRNWVQKPGSRNWSRNYGGMLRNSLFSRAYSPLLVQSFSCSGMAPTMAWALPHQSSIKKNSPQAYLQANQMGAFSQLSFPLLKWLYLVLS